MKTLEVINALDVASPCRASWGDMAGDDRSRHCSQCDKSVYNIAAMTANEVADLIRESEGHFCGRLYRRRDGTVLSADCPVGKLAFASGRFHRVMTCGVLGLGFLTTGAFLVGSSDRETVDPPSGPGATFSDWADWALQMLGFRARPSMVMGEIPSPPTIMGKISVPNPVCTSSGEPTGGSETPWSSESEIPPPNQNEAGPTVEEGIPAPGA